MPAEHLDAPAWRVALLNGLNMTNLGRRDRNVYGTIGSLQELEHLVTAAGRHLDTHVLAYHSNHEGDLVDFIEHHGPRLHLRDDGVELDGQNNDV